MTHPREADPLAPVLHLAEVELEAKLQEACERQEITRESTGELMRLEETLLEAARVAKQTVSLRRRIRTRTPDEGDEQPDSAEPARTASDLELTVPHSDETGASESSVREFTDERGATF